MLKNLNINFILNAFAFQKNKQRNPAKFIIHSQNLHQTTNKLQSFQSLIHT